MLLASNLDIGHSDIYRGESRDVYELENKIVSVATDRIAVFGHVFSEPIPHKGQVLTLLTEYFADATKNIMPNWIEQVIDPNVTIGKKCQRFEVNMVIRGALTGHAWRIYEAGMRSICGVELPDGMKEYDFFEEPIVTPSTKAPNGFEEDISAAQLIDQGIMSESEFERLSIVARQLFIRGKQMAREKGLILADTKYEFGKYNGEIYLIDEIHTPDSSRYFYLDEYNNYLSNKSPKPKNLSKELVRQWALANNYSGLEDQIPPVLSKSFATEISQCYVTVYEILTGKKIINNEENIERRINTNIKVALN